MMQNMKRGRPKSFDDNDALESAMQVFWRSGYDAASLDELLNAMQIPRQSLYRTFSDKRGLFLKALELYANRMTGGISQILHADDLAVNNIEQVFLLWSQRLNAKEKNGCLMQNTCSQSIMQDEEVKKLLKDHQKRMIVAFEKAVKRAQSEGDIHETINAKAVARTVITTINGLLGLSRIGLSSKYIKDVIQTLKSLIVAN